MQEHLTRCSDSNGNVGNCNDGNVMVVMLMMVMVMVMVHNDNAKTVYLLYFSNLPVLSSQNA